ncbi:MAG: DivIVA domain-containing protein [Bacilli bacterium]
MEKFNRTLRGYDPVEVNQFLDQVIKQVEKMVNEMKDKDARIKELEALEEENMALKEKLVQYTRTEETLNKAILMAQKTSDQMRLAAHRESELIVDDAKKNANRIVNEALLRAEKTEMEADMLKRNINVFKRRLKDIVESQLEVIKDIEKVEL